VAATAVDISWKTAVERCVCYGR